MATAVYLPASDATPLNEVAVGLGSSNGQMHTHSSSLSQRLPMTELDLRDDRYPAMVTPLPTASSQPQSPPAVSRAAVDAGMTSALRASYDQTYAPSSTPPQGWLGENITQEPVDDWNPSRSTPPDALLEAQFRSPVEDATMSSGLRHNDSYPLDDAPTSGPLDDAAHAAAHAAMVPLPTSPEPFPRPSDRWPSEDQLESAATNGPLSSRNAGMSLGSGAVPHTPLVSPGAASSPRHPSLPAAGIGAASNSSPLPPIVPLSAGPSYNPSAIQMPISQTPRAYAQHPTYITPSTAAPMQPSFSPPQMPREEVCVECAMRDQDMADVDVTSPGVWDRESDVMYEELCRREAEEEMSGQTSSDNHSRPRASGGMLSEENLKFWMSINPKEPSSRQQTLDMYVKAQRSLLEADALARARALRESRLLDEKMRDTFSQLRRSAYELGSSLQPNDEGGALRIKAPRVASQSSAGPAQGHSREVTLLENGMIVEHVDIRREEKDRRREERRERSRARKTSRSSRSAADVASVYSMPLGSPLPPMDSGFFSNARDSARYSQSFSPRPSSITANGDRLLRAQSQASFSDMMSMTSGTSPRRSRFFGFRNLSSAWMSRDSVGPTGSMMDMHVALQQEQQYFAAHPSALDLSSQTPTLRASQSGSRMVASPEPDRSTTPSTKKKSGLKKIWKLVTGGSKSSKTPSQTRSADRHEDDMPLAPPPPLSYLVDREGGGNRRHVSTPSLLSSVSPNQFSQWAPSPPTAPSSALPSPTSSRYLFPSNRLWRNRMSAFDLGSSGDNSDGDQRGRATQSSSRTLSSLGPATPGNSPSARPQSVVMRRDKSLPPIPGESAVEFPSHPMPDIRPQTMLSGGLVPPQAPFRTMDARRQSFGGTASVPHPAVQSMPGRRGAPNVPPFLAEEKYAEFGASTPSLAQWGPTHASKRSLTTPMKPKQRRSRFGLSSLFGKKSSEMSRESQMYATNVSNGSVDYNPYRTSVSEHRDEQSQWTGPGSAHSSNPARMSIGTSKNIAALVEQDPEFVAYRYPSSGQRLEVLR
ncbi:uncharacterized protein BXZ73DRAFT_90223 [Epithele typhae]|uniref:uncharacterized protein n=1 Tax=Epithele typhae TaxID=378194 RepID=UPI002007A793|nr:uncharacterized protein BXZ73DRAFT_90223 [Epithele typhae]KAH9931151.1 hypothetical protein BXZ73DRAFT_90223 [Epithele typhae]